MIHRGRDLSQPQDLVELRVRAHEPLRLDVYLRDALVWKSRGRIQELIRSGWIRVNGKPAKPAQGVRGGDLIEVRLSRGTGLPADYGDRSVSIIYEDRWLVAVDKPPGLLVHPTGRHVYDTLMNYLHYRYQGEREAADGDPPASSPEESGSGGEAPAASRQPPDGPRPGEHYRKRMEERLALRLCHRIDRETTGILLVAKEAYVHRMVQAQFSERRVKKEYLALVIGAVPEGTDEIDIPIGEGATLEEALAPPRKPTRTRIAVLERFSGPSGDLTLLAARPVTGRQNQIRVHLAAIGHPIAGDSRYGRPPPEGFPERYLLHARSLRFFHPRLKTAVELEAALPPDFQELLGRLREGGRLEA